MVLISVNNIFNYGSPRSPYCSIAFGNVFNLQGTENTAHSDGNKWSLFFSHDRQVGGAVLIQLPSGVRTTSVGLAL